VLDELYLCHQVEKNNTWFSGEGVTHMQDCNIKSAYRLVPVQPQDRLIRQWLGMNSFTSQTFIFFYFRHQAL